MRKYFLIFITLMMAVLACNKNNSDDTILIDDFHENYYTVNINPALQNFKTAINTQVLLTNVFNDSPTTENLQALQDQWLVSAKCFSKISAYNVLALKAEFLDVLIYNFDVLPSGIEESIAEETTYDLDYFNARSTVIKGLGTLEYLLFNNQDSDTAFTLLTENPYRLDYFIGVTNDVLERTNSLISFWSEYKETFINATNTSCADNARCLAFNQLINVIDVIRVTKLGKPAGLESSSESNVEGLEAFRSENSLILLKSALQEIEYVYTHSSVNFSEIVTNISGSAEVSDAINTSFTNTYNIIEAIDTSLYTAILNEDPNVELLYNSLFTLV